MLNGVFKIGSHALYWPGASDLHCTVGRPT